MAEFIKQSWPFPVIQSVHLIGLTILVGTICLLDFRLLGIGLRRRTAAEIASALKPWTSAGFVTVLVTGPLMFWSDLSRYLSNPAFVLKMGLLAVALAGHFTLHRSVLRNTNGSGTTRQRLAAVLSLILWSSVILAAVRSRTSTFARPEQRQMSILEFCEQIQDTWLSRTISESTWGYPMIGALHVLAIAVFGGALLVPCVRSFAFLSADTRRIRRIGMTLIVVTGVLLFVSGAVGYSRSTAFKFKLVLLGLIALNAFVFRTKEVHGRLRAAISLALWAAVIFASRGIAFY